MDQRRSVDSELCETQARWHEGGNMKIRKLRRTQSRRWDSVHKSWDAVLDNNAMWPIRKVKPCRTYSAWCSDCNAALFRLEKQRFPRTVDEFYAFEQDMQDAEGQP
jgi:hypothetical protein